MISFFAAGSATIPPLDPNETADVTVPLDREMANDEYTVSIIPPAQMLAGLITAEITEQTVTDVTVQVTATNGIAGEPVLTVIAIQ